MNSINIRKPNRKVKKQTEHAPLPVTADVRTSASERARIERIVKSNNGNHSKYIPGKWGYGAKGPQKY